MTLAETIQKYRIQFWVTLLLLAGLYFAVVQQMVVQWCSDENYSHGFLVPVISGYFIYERRKELAKCLVSPWLPGLAVVFFGLLQLVIGHAAGEFFTQRSSLIILLAGLVLFFLGRQIFKLLVMPIAYLILMVPLPYIVYNAVAFPLKLVITKVSVSFLQALGVVVLHEGNILLFPSITLEVADACSGIRSLVSLLALAFAAAFFVNTTKLKRIILVLSAIPVALFTNAMRVIVTGVLAQKWGAQAAEGFFHEFAGMMVFLVAMALLAGIGVLLAEPDDGMGEAAREENPPDTSGGFKHISASSFVTVGVMMTLAWTFIMFRSDLQVPTNRPFSEFPSTLNGWQMVSQQILTADVLGVLRPTDYISRTYSAPDGAQVMLYIGYHGGGKDVGEIHSPNHCLPGSGWHKISSSNMLIDTASGRINLVKAEYRQGELKEQFYYWFQVGDRTVSSEYTLKLAELTGSIFHRRRDASFIRISIPVGLENDKSAAAAEKYIRDFYPVIRAFLPK